MAKILKIAIPILFLFFLLAWERAHLVRLNFRIEELRRKRDHLLTEVYSLEVEAESLENYSRLENLARVKLNMLYPNSKDIVYIKKDRRK